MIKLITTGILCLAVVSSEAQVHPNDYLWYNNGAEVYIGSNCLLTVQGDVTTNQATVAGITHLTNNGMLWVQGNLYGDALFKQTGTGILRMQNKTNLYTAPYSGESYQVISGGYQVHGGQAAIGTDNDGSIYALQLDNSNGSVFMADSTDVRSSVDFLPAAITIDNISIAPNGNKNTIRTYNPGTGTTATAAPANGANYTATFGMMNPVGGSASFMNVSTNLMANTAVLDSGYIQGKLRRAIDATQGGVYGFPLGLEPDASNNAARGIQYISLNINGTNNYDVITGYFQRGADNTVTGLTEACAAVSEFEYYGATHHGVWSMNAYNTSPALYGTTIYPQDYGTLNSEVYFITKSNTAVNLTTVPLSQSCGTSPDGLSTSNLVGFSAFGFGGGSTEPLPIDLIQFTASAEGCKVTLQWQIAAATTLKLFNIDYSNDGNYFKQIAKVDYNGTNIYSFNHKQPDRSGFYRITLLDINGKKSLSNVLHVTAHCEASNEMVLSPNPVTAVLFMNNMVAGKKQISLINAVGATLHTFITEHVSAEMNMQSFAAGLYNIRIEDASGKITNTKIVKL